MKYKSFLGILLTIFIFSVAFLSCSPEGTSQVTITIDLGLQNNTALNTDENSIIDRIFRFFVKDARAQTVPTGITSIGLSITGEGMSTINRSYSPDTSTITLNVPAGPARVFQVTANRPTGNWGGLSEPHNLEAGQSVEIPISMAEQYTSVIINPAYPNGTPASSTLTYIVYVTTSGQAVPLSPSFTPNITIYVPSGASKDFEVLVNTPSVTFRGLVTGINLANSAVTITPSMALYETKIIVPDYNNSRIVQIDDMIGSNWAEKTGFSGFTGNFRPYGIDFDNQGRIYISNSGFSTGDGRILRIDDITVTACTLLTASSGAGDFNRHAIAIDRINNYLYYANDGENRIYMYNISTIDDTTSFANPVPETFGYITGLALDNTGYIYITCGNIYKHVVKYNLNTQTRDNYVTTDSSDTTHYVTWLGQPWDVIVKSNFIYIADYANKQITQLNPNLAYQAILTASPSGTNLLGPRRFASILNRRFYVTDDDGTYAAQLNAFDDIIGNNWEAYGSHGSTTGTFRFWCSC